MRIKVRMWLNLDVDPEDYLIPSDGDITAEVEDGIREYIHDINGVEIKSMKVTQEIKDE
jgi:hypothetical protein